jgi:hypothetical protein
METVDFAIAIICPIVGIFLAPISVKFFVSQGYHKKPFVYIPYMTFLVSLILTELLLFIRLGREWYWTGHHVHKHYLNVEDILTDYYGTLLFGVITSLIAFAIVYFGHRDNFKIIK